MAGSFADVPAPKIFYESDDTLMFVNTTEQTNQSNKNNWNDDAIGGPAIGGGYAGLVFPRLMDIKGVNFAHGSGSNSFTTSTSPDTTNMVDGTWTSQPTGLTGALALAVPAFRRPQTVSLLGIKGIRMQMGFTGGDTSLYMMNVYGAPSSLTGLNKLVFWAPTTDVVLPPAALDYGNVPRLDNVTKTFRVKNNHTLTANGVNISMAELSAPSPTIPSQTTFALGAGAFAAGPLAVGDLAPGAISAVISMRISLLNTATLGAWRQRLQAVATSFS